MLNRLIFNALYTWSQSDKRKPLILRGARQVGKTTMVNEFAANYDQFLSLNLEKKADRDLFEQNNSINELIAAIHFHKNRTVNPDGKTLIFIDEIQYCPQAATMLRYFYEERNDIHVIAAGSLLETLINRQISFPVGRVEYQWMYPLSFYEYLMANKQARALEILEEKPCPNFAHTKLLKLFFEYTLVGGMPEAVTAYLPEKDILSVNKVYEAILTAYMDDVEKYAPNRTMVNIIRHAIAYAPLAAGSRIKFVGFGQSNYKSREVGEALRLLEKAMLIQLVYPTVATTPPASGDYKKSPKLQFLDTGMMNFAAGLQQHYFNLEELNTLYKGQVSENIVGQELLANHINFNQKLKFWVREKKQSNAEVDFIVLFDKYLVPIEIKSGKT
ncbi:MAG: AAA family ATPase, partial [Pseudomonadota bacterium]